MGASTFCGRDFGTKAWKQVPSEEGILELRRGESTFCGRDFGSKGWKQAPSV